MEVNFQQSELVVDGGRPLFFVVHDGYLFRLLEASADAEVVVFKVSHDELMAISSRLGSEANAAIYANPWIASGGMSAELNQLQYHAFAQLALLDKAHVCRERESMLTYLYTNILLTFYNGIEQIENQSSRQTFELMNRFYDLWSEPESYLHRDTQYFADRLHITTRYLFEVCKKESGRSPKDFINESIVSDIGHTMINTTLSFQQISLKYNFPDQTAFTQFFKRQTGMTPTEFRRRYK